MFVLIWVIFAVAPYCFQSYQSVKRFWKGLTFDSDCRERREFSAQGECMPCDPECKVQEGKQTCTGPVGFTLYWYTSEAGQWFSRNYFCTPYCQGFLSALLSSVNQIVPLSFKGADQCVACARLQDGPHCVSECPEGLMGGEGFIFKYPNKQGSCEPCHINCTKGWDICWLFFGVYLHIRFWFKLTPFFMFPDATDQE